MTYGLLSGRQKTGVEKKILVLRRAARSNDNFDLKNQMANGRLHDMLALGRHVL